MELVKLQVFTVGVSHLTSLGREGAEIWISNEYVADAVDAADTGSGIPFWEPLR